ncbi:MAG: hypothetical protein ACFE75_07710 [Candidatus Hodarchaeota archaeon]
MRKNQRKGLIFLVVGLVIILIWFCGMFMFGYVVSTVFRYTSGFAFIISFILVMIGINKFAKSKRLMNLEED